jgi:hypothetical protein
MSLNPHGTELMLFGLTNKRDCAFKFLLMTVSIPFLFSLFILWYLGFRRIV